MQKMLLSWFLLLYRYLFKASPTTLTTPTFVPAVMINASVKENKLYTKNFGIQFLLVSLAAATKDDWKASSTPMGTS